jgi:hypothetical protein
LACLDFVAELHENDHQRKEADGREDVGDVEHGMVCLVLFILVEMRARWRSEMRCDAKSHTATMTRAIM